MNLRDWRKSKKLTQAAAGDLFGLSQPTLAKIEAGDQWPSPETISAIETGTKGAVTAYDIIATYRKERAA